MILCVAPVVQLTEGASKKKPLPPPVPSLFADMSVATLQQEAMAFVQSSPLLVRACVFVHLVWMFSSRLVCLFFFLFVSIPQFAISFSVILPQDNEHFKPCFNDDVFKAFSDKAEDYRVFHKSLTKAMKAAAKGFVLKLAEGVGWKKKALPPHLSSKKALSLAACSISHALLLCKAARRVEVLSKKAAELNALQGEASQLVAQC